MNTNNKMVLDRDEAIEILSSIKASTLSVHSEIMKSLEEFVDGTGFEITSSVDIQKEIGAINGTVMSEGYTHPVINLSISHQGKEAAYIPLSVSDTAGLIQKLQFQFDRASETKSIQRNLVEAIKIDVKPERLGQILMAQANVRP